MKNIRFFFYLKFSVFGDEIFYIFELAYFRNEKYKIQIDLQNQFSVKKFKKKITTLSSAEIEPR